MSLGCYTESQGIEFVRENVASYIERRDGYPANKDDIFLTNGASSSVKVLFYFQIYLPIICSLCLEFI